MSVVRTYEEDRQYIYRDKDDKNVLHIQKGFVPGMNVPAAAYVNDRLEGLLMEEMRVYNTNRGFGGFLPALKQLANVATLPGIVGHSLGLPDIHAGYGFAIGSVAAFDCSKKDSVVCPGGVGFDINCGVRIINTNLQEKDIRNKQEELANCLFKYVPVGVGSQGIIPCNMQDLDSSLELGLDWVIRQGYAWPEDKEHCEEYGRMLTADPSKVSIRAKKRGLPQMGTLGAGNHYCEVQVVDEIYDEFAAKIMGLEKGQVCVMVHSGSRGLGHQVATDALVVMEKCMQKNNFFPIDKQLACAPMHSKEGQDYLASMAAAANYAWTNRGCVSFLVREAFSKVFKSSPDDLNMNILYDVSHNIAKFEEHMTNDGIKRLLVLRKGATRSFPANHPLTPLSYILIGQPVLIGGTMGTYSYILLGNNKEEGRRKKKEEKKINNLFINNFFSTCHGAGRSKSRNFSRNSLNFNQVIQQLQDQQISVRVASPKLVAEEAPFSYKDVNEVVDVCHDAGLSKKVVRLRPIIVVKG